MEVGKDVTGLSVGDVVVGLVNDGGIQEEVTMADYMMEMVNIKLSDCL